MVRETRYLYVGNLPESIIEERILDLFSSYGKIQGVKILTSGSDGPSKQSAIVAFMDIKSASKAQESEIILDGKVLVTQYNESSMTVTVQTDKKETTTKQHSPGDTDGITSYATRSKSASHESPSQAHLHNFQKVTSSNVQTSKYDETLKPLGMLFQGFPTRSTDSSIRDGLYHDYKKYGKVLSINVIGQGEERHAIVSFKKAEDAAKALEASHDKKFFGAILQVFPHEGLDIKAEFRQQDEQDEYHPKASRTLFVGNLDKNTSKELLKDTLSKYGYIIDIDIKNQSQGTCYAFIQYDNIRSVVQALKDLEDEHINNSKVKVGFGKSMPTTCVWIEGISDTISEKYLALQHLSCYGCIAALYIDRNTTRALVYYDNVDQAFVAVKDLKGRIVSDKRIQVDFASRDCQNLFLDAMEQSGQLRPGDRPEDRINRGTHPFEGCEFTRQWPFDPNQPRNRFFPYEGPSVARGGYASRPYFAPGRPATSRLPFYDGFEQRRENCMGVRSSFKPSFEQLYEKDALVINRNIKERSLSLERSRSLYRGVLESSVSRDDDVRYSEEWDVVEEKESVKKLERKRSRHHHKDKSPLSISLDSKGSMKKVGQSPLFQTNYPQSVKKHGKSVKSSRSANDAFNRRSHLKNEGNVENWIDLNTYSESEKGRCKRSSPSRRKKSKNSESNTKRTSRKSKNYSDESSRSSSILSSESLISLNSESGDSASKSSDEVDLLVKKKQELIKMLEAMEEEAVDPEQEDDDFEMDMCPSNDCNDDKNGDVKVIPNEAKDQKRKSSRSCSLDSSDKSTKSKGKPGTERCSNSSTTESEAGFVKKKNFPIKTDSITSPIAVPKTKSPQDENVTYSKSKHSKKECVTDKICQKMEENETFDKKDETLIKECFSPPEQAQVESEPIALDSIKTEPEVCLANPVNVGEMEVNKQQAGDSVVSMGEFCEEKSYEPRNVDKSKKVREVMSLPLPRFAFDLPSLRKKNTTGESEKSDGPLDSKTCHNTPAATASVKSEVLVSPPNIMSEEESCTNAKTNRESSNSDSVKVEDEAKEVEENEKISKVKEESSECSEKIEPADVEATKSAGTVETYQSIKCDPLDYKQETKDDFMASVLDDLRMESGENIEDDTSLEERIRALDEKLSKIQQGNSKLPSSNLLQPDNSHPTTNTVTSLDYREKYKRHRREHPAANVPVVSEPQRLEPSDLAKILLSRSSIFDQDTQRLEMLNKITKNDNNGTSAALNFPIHSPNSFHTSLQPIAQNVTPPLFSGLKGLIPSLPLTSSFTARFNSSMSHLSSYNVSLTSFKTSEVNHKAYVDGSMRMPPLTSLHTSVSGDPRRIAKPLDILSTTTKPGLSNDVQGSQFADLCDTHGVIPGTQGSSKSNPPVSILKKQGSVHDEAPQVMEPSSNDVVLQQVHSNKRKSEVAFGSEQHSKQPGKVLITDKSETTPGKLPSVKSQNTVAGNTLIKSTNKPTTVPKSTLKSQQGQIVKNKPANVASKPSNPEKRTSKTDDGVSNATSKREYDSGSKSHTNSDLKSKENVDDDKQTSKEKNRDKLAIAKRSHEEPKEDSDKKAKPLTKSNAPIDLKDSSKKEIKKDDQKSALSSIKSLNKIPSKSKSLQEVQNKKSEDVQKDKSHGDKTQPLQKTEKVVSKPKLTQKSSDDGKELKMPSKPTVLLKEDKKSKMKMVNSLGKGTPHDSVKKSSKPNFVSSCSSKEKKPEEKREVKALLQELGSAEDNAPQYVSMYDMVKRRSNKDASVSKGKEVRTKSLSQLKSSKKRCQSRKNSLRLSSNDSDSNADCGSSMKHKSRQKRISSSSSSSSTSESPSSSGSEDDEKDVTIRKTKKKPGGYFRSAPVKRKVFPDSSSDESIDQDIVPKTKKFLAEKPKSSDSRMETVKSPAYADYPPRKLPSISESLANKEDLHYSTQSSSSASEDVMPAKESPSVEIKKNDSIPQDFDLNLCPESEKDDEQVTDKNIKKELNLASSNLQSNDESNSCISEAKTVRDDERSSIECDAKSQTEKIEDYDKMEIRDCMSDDALLDQMDDDSIVTPLPGFEGVTFELAAQNQEKQEDGGFKVGIVENTFSGVFVISKSLIDTSTKENVCQVEPSSGSTFGSDVCATNVESFSNKSQLGSEVGEPVFDDVDTDNNTEELDLAIKSLFRDGEETKYDQTLEFSEKKDDETLSSRIDIGSPAFGSSFASTSNSKEVTDAPEEDIKLNAESSQPVDVKLEKEENECTDEKSELNATDDSEVKSIATASIDNSKESSRPKEFTGHFISTFKPEQSECAEQNLASPKAVTKCKDSIESLSANDCTMEDVSKKRLCEDEYDAPNKKIKLEDGEQSTNVPDKESANNVNDSSLPIVSKSESEAGLCEAVVTSSDHQRSPSVQSHLVSSTSFSKSAMQSSEASCRLVAATIPTFQSYSSNITSASYPITCESSGFATTCQSNVERVIEEVAKGNFERGYEADYYVSQKKLKVKNKDDAITNSNVLIPSHSINSPAFSTVSMSQVSQCQSAPQGHFFSRNMQGLGSQTVPATAMPMPAQNVLIASSEVACQPQNITIMTGSGLVQVSSSNIPSIQHLQMYSAGVAAARQLASSQLQQSLAVNHDMLTQHRLLRPSVDAAPISFRPQNTSVSTAGMNLIQPQCQLQVHHQIPSNQLQQGPNSQPVHQRLPHSPDKLAPASQHRLQSVEVANSVQQNMLGQPIHSFQYQPRPGIISTQVQLPNSSNPGQTCNSFMQQQQELFNRSNMLFRGQMKMDQQPSFAAMDNLSRQISPKVLEVSQQGNVRPSLPNLASPQTPIPQMTKGNNLPSDVLEGMQNNLRPMMTKGDCRQQQLFIRPIVAMQQQQQQQPLSTSSCMEQSSVAIGQHRMPITVKEPRLVSNLTRAEPKTPGTNTIQQPPLMLSIGSVGQQVQNQSGPHDSLTQQPSINLFPGLTSPPVGILGSAVLIPPQQQQLALEKSLLLNASVHQQQQQRLVQPAAVFQYAAPSQHVNLHHLSNTSQLEFFVAGNRMVAPIIQALPTDSMINHGQAQPTQGIHLSTHMQPSMMQQQRPNPESLDRGLAVLSQKLPVVWQGLLALKNDSAHVQMHYVCGSKNLVQASLPDNVAPLRIAQRMRLEPTQLEQVTKRMNESDFSMLLAVPCGRDPVEIMTQSHNLQTFFIHYLQQKQAAGIVNILQPNSTQTAYVVHIFPPCEFSLNNLNRLPPDVVQNLGEGGYLLIIITTC